jgi:predicted nucleic acid-binding protein
MSGKVVVDTSLALKWVVAEADSSLARGLLSSWIANGYDIIAPSLYASEVANALHQKARRGLISPDEAKRYLADLVLAGPTLDFSLDAAINLALSNRALELAQRHGLSAVYDAHYLALAEREHCEYWTADERLWNSVRAQLGWVRWLGEYSAAGSPTAVP